MDLGTTLTNEHKNELLDAQAHIWNHIFYFYNSMALKCAIQLGIPDAISKHSKPITLEELANSLTIHPNKTPFLSRLMRLLVHSKFFSKENSCTGEDEFSLTINSKLLLSDYPLTLAPFTLALLNPTLIEPSQHLSTWFRSDDESPFHTAHGKSLWDYASTDLEFNTYFNQAMASDANFVATVLLTKSELKGVFKRLDSLVDVGGGTGTMAKAIAKAHPSLKCIVFDLPHVVEGLQDSGSNLVYVKGDMFEAIPPAQAVLLKWILHDWSDDHCIKILEQCKLAIPHKDQGGKVIIIDVVVEISPSNKSYQNAQLLFDMEMLSCCIGGKERCEEEWKQMFLKAGYSDYKIFPLLGPRSIIEVYPA